jgi:transposase-like protein
MIGGVNIKTEVDESKFNDFWVFGGIERTNQKKCFFVVVNNREKETLHELIKRYIRPGSTIYSDSWKGYYGLNRLNYVHKTINHTKHMYDPRTRVHTNHIENSWFQLKKFIPKEKRRRDKIDQYLKEYIWRHKHKSNLWNSFLDLLKL